LPLALCIENWNKTSSIKLDVPVVADDRSKVQDSVDKRVSRLLTTFDRQLPLGAAIAAAKACGVPEKDVQEILDGELCRVADHVGLVSHCQETTTVKFLHDGSLHDYTENSHSVRIVHEHRDGLAALVQRYRNDDEGEKQLQRLQKMGMGQLRGAALKHEDESTVSALMNSENSRSDLIRLILRHEL
jgi:hypothetical protein